MSATTFREPRDLAAFRSDGVRITWGSQLMMAQCTTEGCRWLTMRRDPAPCMSCRAESRP